MFYVIGGRKYRNLGSYDMGVYLINYGVAIIDKVYLKII